MSPRSVSAPTAPKSFAPRVGRLISFLGCALSLQASPAAAQRPPAVPPSRGGLAAAPPWSGVSGTSPLPFTRARVTFPPVRHPAVHPARSESVPPIRPLFPRAEDVVKQKKERAAAMLRHPAGKAARSQISPADTAPAPRAEPTLSPSETIRTCTQSYRVRQGDSLWSIAAGIVGRPSDAAVHEMTMQLYEANRQTVGEDPDLIRPGQSLSLPRKCEK